MSRARPYDLTVNEATMKKLAMTAIAAAIGLTSLSTKLQILSRVKTIRCWQTQKKLKAIKSLFVNFFGMVAHTATN